MSMFGRQEHITGNTPPPLSASATDAVAIGLPSSISLNALTPHTASSHAPHNTAALSPGRYAPAVQAGEFSWSAGEFRLARLHSDGVFVETCTACQSVGSCSGNSQPGVDCASLAEPWHSPLCVLPQVNVSVDSSEVVLPRDNIRSPSRHACQSVDLDHKVFSDFQHCVEEPPPLPPKTSVVSRSFSTRVCVSAVRIFKISNRIE